MNATQPTTEPATIVLFRMEGDSPVAFFPELPATYHDDSMVCYAHLGQHGAASPVYVSRLKKATPEQYAPLKAELESIGYKLDVRARSCPAYANSRRQIRAIS